MSTAVLGGSLCCDANLMAALITGIHVHRDYTQFTKGLSGFFSAKTWCVQGVDDRRANLEVSPGLNDPPTVERDAEPCVCVVLVTLLSTLYQSPQALTRRTNSNKYSFRGNAAKLEKAASAIEAALQKMQELGATVISMQNIPSMQDLVNNGFQAQAIIQNTEFKEEIAKYLRTMASTEVRNLSDIIELVHSFLP